MPKDLLPTAAMDGLDSLDHRLHAALAEASQGLSPIATAQAWLDWAANLQMSPGRQAKLAFDAAQAMVGLTTAVMAGQAPADRRFAGADWGRWPFNLMSHSFLAAERWWRAATDIPGMGEKSAQLVRFGVQQALQLASPAHYPAANPEALRATWTEGGANLVRGMEFLAADAGNAPQDTGFKAGRELALTPGRVVFRNELLELIQYAPATPKTKPEPVLIVPAWIMKYYILDLRPENSLVRYLVSRGHTVFAVSWRNPTREQQNLGMEDYRRDGVMAALDAVAGIMPGRKVHAAGYCLGGTLLSIAAAAMARDGDDRLASATLLAAQTDFTEAGELLTFIDEHSLPWLDSLMAGKGTLEGSRMGAAFQLLRAEELIWAPMMKRYVMGEVDRPNDLMAWNADQTRMPHRMHSEYLKGMFLRNDLAEGRYLAGGAPVALRDIRAPFFVVGTTKDHVAPWRSVHKLHLFARSAVTFCLTSGGHNAGIVSEPGHAGRSYQLATQGEADAYLGPDAWAAKAPTHEGSWWEAWSAWLSQRSGAEVEPPALGEGLCAAPGTYVFQH